MLIGTVVGSIVSTQKDEKLIGYKLLIVKRLNANGDICQDLDMVAVDFAGAGIGDKVLLSSGSSARYLADNPQAPIDLAIVGIIDHLKTD